MCVTISEDVVVNDPDVKTKILEGGLYAVTGVKRNDIGDVGNEIMQVWKRFQNWIADSKYAYGGHQWLEEHLGFDEDFNHIGRIDLYMPIVEKSNIDTNKMFKNIETMYTASYQVTGKNAADTARKYFFEWAEREGLFRNNSSPRFFAYYNHERIGYDDFFFKIHVTIDKGFRPTDPNINIEEFTGGYYAVMKSKYKYNGWHGEILLNGCQKVASTLSETIGSLKNI